MIVRMLEITLNARLSGLQGPALPCQSVILQILEMLQFIREMMAGLISLFPMELLRIIFPGLDQMTLQVVKKIFQAWL